MCYGTAAVQRYVAQQQMQRSVDREKKEERSPRFGPSPQTAIDASLRGLALGPDDVLYDLGCGDGRVLLQAARLYGCRCIGIEKDRETATLARDKVKEAGWDHKVTIYCGDVTTCSLAEATAAYCYLDQVTLDQAIGRLPSGCRVASFSHPLPLCSSQEKTSAGTVYYWKPPSLGDSIAQDWQPLGGTTVANRSSQWVVLGEDTMWTVLK